MENGSEGGERGFRGCLVDVVLLATYALSILGAGTIIFNDYIHWTDNYELLGDEQQILFQIQKQISQAFETSGDLEIFLRIGLPAVLLLISWVFNHYALAKRYEDSQIPE